MIFDRTKWFEVVESGANYALVRMCEITEVTAVQAFDYEGCHEWLAQRGLNESIDYNIKRTNGLETEDHTFIAYSRQGVVAEVKAHIAEHGKSGKPVRYDFGTVAGDNFSRDRFYMNADGLKVGAKGWQSTIPPDSQTIKPHQMLSLYRYVVWLAAKQAGSAIGVDVDVKGMSGMDAVQLKEIYTKFMKLGGLKLNDLQAVRYEYEGNVKQEITHTGIDALTIDMHHYGTFNGPKQREEAKKLLKKWLTSKVVK